MGSKPLEDGGGRRPPVLVWPSAWEAFVLTMGVFLTMRYSWLMDDAFVYFRYVDNLVFLDYGLVYNKGEYVEGFSSPLWALYLSLLRSFELSFPFIIEATAVFSYIGFGFILVCINRHFSSPGVPVVNVPLIYLTFNYGIMTYFTSGLESPFVHLIAAFYGLFLCFPNSRVLQIVIGLSPLIRHELALPGLLAFAAGWFFAKRPPWIMALTAVVSGGGLLIARVIYYAEILPNTFYLKDESNWNQGLRYLSDTLNTYHAYVFFAIVTLLLLIALMHAADRRGLLTRLAMLLLAASVALYVVRIGGDARHFRYLGFSFILAVIAFSGVFEQALSLLPRRAWTATGGAVAAGLAVVTLLCYPVNLSAHPLFFRAESEVVNGISEAHGHRISPMMAYENWQSRVGPIQYRAFLAEDGKQGEVIGEHYCAEIYKQFDTHVVHTLGLTDAYLARTNMKTDRPAHKFGLKPLGFQLAELRERAGGLGVGMHRRAVEEGYAPSWVAENLDSFELIERKVFNQHRLWENVWISLTPIPRINP